MALFLKVAYSVNVVISEQILNVTRDIISSIVQVQATTSIVGCVILFYLRAFVVSKFKRCYDFSLCRKVEKKFVCSAD